MDCSFHVPSIAVARLRADGAGRRRFGDSDWAYPGKKSTSTMPALKLLFSMTTHRPIVHTFSENAKITITMAPCKIALPLDRQTCLLPSVEASARQSLPLPPPAGLSFRVLTRPVLYPLLERVPLPPASLTSDQLRPQPLQRLACF
jgi:hypothetical protein